MEHPKGEEKIVDQDHERQTYGSLRGHKGSQTQRDLGRDTIRFHTFFGKGIETVRKSTLE